jgi:hypothetical protein
LKEEDLKLKLKEAYLIALVITLCVFVSADHRAVLVHNTRQEIEACKGKLKLELVRIWGGEKEEDEHKFFRTPSSAAVNKKNGLVYICDQHAHCIKVFKNSREYVRTIGTRGRGPGDVYCPVSIALSPEGDLVVCELGGKRFQRFSPGGKSKQIIKFKEPALAWVVGVTSKDELVVSNHDETLRSRKLVSILDDKGNAVREIGTYHDKSKSYIESESILFAMDDSNNIYAGNTSTPVIRKYSIGGRLLRAITFELPFETAPVEITLNSTGDEMKIVREDEKPDKVQVKKKGDSITIQGVKKKGKPRVGAGAIGTDRQKRIYIVTRRRLLTEKERQATRVGWSFEFMKRDRVDFDIVENIDVNMLLVFNPEGKIIAEAQLTTFCNGIHISGNRIFIVDGNLNQRILEYEMHFED